jgi:predicted lactoylglutathione lyase
MRKYFYFRTEADEDDDDDIARSLMIPVDNLMGMYPTSNTALTLTFKPVLRNVSDGQDGNVANNDTVILNISSNQAKEVMTAIARAANAGGTAYSDGVIVVADDATTDYDGTTKDAIVLDSNITSCGAIAIAAVLS